MFKPTAALLRAPATRRLQLTTKQAGKHYYKGNRTGATGVHTRWGGYIIQLRRVRTYVAPDTADFDLTPFVAEKIEKPKGSFGGFDGPMDGKHFLMQWKEAGGQN